MAKKTKAKTMVETVKEMGKELGLDLKFEPDKSLRDYRKGRELKMSDLKKASEVKGVVWVYYKEHGAEEPRINDAQWVEHENNSFIFTDGTSFGSDLDVGPDDALAVDGKCGEGHFQVFEAIKMTKEEVAGLKKAMKAIEDFRKKIKKEAR